jgi:hypothetical protein
VDDPIPREMPELERVKVGAAMVRGTTTVDVVVPETPVTVTLDSPGIADVAAVNVSVL